MTKREKEKQKRKEYKRKMKEYERNFDRFGNPVISSIRPNPYQRVIMKEEGFSDQEIDNFFRTYFSSLQEVI